MASVITPESAKQIAQKHFEAFAKTADDIEDILHDGTLNMKNLKLDQPENLKQIFGGAGNGGETQDEGTQYIEQHAKRVTRVVQTCNVSMRWLLLNVFTEHTHSKAVRSAVSGAGACGREIVRTLLGLVVVENELLQVVRHLVETKKERWTRTQEDIVLSFTDLGEFYSGTQVRSDAFGRPISPYSANINPFLSFPFRSCRGGSKSRTRACESTLIRWRTT